MKTKLTILLLLFVGVAMGQKIDVTTAVYPRSVYIQGSDTNRINGDKFIYVGKDTTNSTRFEQDGSIRMIGTATQWTDLMFPFTTGRIGTTGYPTLNEDSLYYTFTTPDTTGSSKCIMYFIGQMPHDYVENSRLYPHVHYKHEVGVGTPNFMVRYKFYNYASNASLIPWHWYKMNLTTGTTDKTIQMSYGNGGINGTHGISSMILMMVYTYATPSNVNAYQFDLHYQRDSFGSRTETAK